MFDPEASHYVNFNLYNNFPYKMVQFIGSDSIIMLPFLFHIPPIISNNEFNQAKLALAISVLIYIYNNLYVALFFMHMFVSEYCTVPRKCGEKDDKRKSGSATQMTDLQEPGSASDRGGISLQIFDSTQLALKNEMSLEDNEKTTMMDTRKHSLSNTVVL